MSKLLSLLLLFGLAACRQDMHDQPKLEPLEASDFFADGRGTRPQVKGTIARGQLQLDDHLFRGTVNGEPAKGFPFPITSAVLERGRERYTIFCAICHDDGGYGRGMAVRRGLKQPTSFHVQRLREAPPGYTFDVITNGFGAMVDYEDRITARDRWSIAAYVRVLQLSQNAQLSDAPEKQRKQLVEGALMAAPLSERLERWQSRAFTVGFVASGLLLLGAALDREQFFQSYLVAFLYWLGLGLGSLAIVMLHHLTGGAWGFAIRRLLEAGTRTLPLLALMLVPVLLGIHYLYEWSHPDVVARDELLQHKAAYLNTPFFVIRAVVYFLIWGFLAFRIGKLTAQHDRSGDGRFRRRLGRLGAIGLVLYVLTMTFAATDWAMSLEPHWFSTIYAAQMIIGQVLGTFCLAVVVAARLSRYEPFSRWLSKDHFHDLGNLMLAFVMLWAYMGFSQYLIIWSGNLAEETPWYVSRTGESWRVLALALVLFHFFVPFVLLLSRKTKRHPQVLAGLALLILVLRLFDITWLVTPAFHPDGLSLSWMDLVAPLALGGLWMGFFVKQLRGRPLISLHEAKLQTELEEVAAS